LDALAAGADTVAPRAAVDAARAALAEFEAAEASAAQAVAAQGAADLAEATSAAQNAAQDALTAAADTVAAPAGVELAAPVLAPAVAAAAGEVARLRLAHEAALELQREAAGRHAALAARHAQKTEAAAAIRARRAGGDEQPDDAAELHLLSLDASGLAELVAAAADDVRAASPDALAPALAAAETALVRAQAEAGLVVMLARVRVIEKALADGVRSLRAEADRLGRSNFGSVFLPADDTKKIASGAWL
jgi:hypothetical protein